ncbi:MAG: aldo/keto reductase [Planctomycetales bacterium]|nr:aldo/keto reductase [Planctomycetales bacterium]
MGLRGPNTWGVRVVDESSAERVLHAVLDHGVNLIDTSPDYGMCERRIGDFISSRRKEYYLATKCGCDPIQHTGHLEIRHTWTRDVIRRNVDESLRRMKTDYIDIIQFHGGDARTLENAGLIDSLVQLRDAGLVRHIGVSSKLPELNDLIALNVFEVFQIPYSCLEPTHESAIRRCAESGAGVIIRGGIAQGGPEAEIQRPAVNDAWAKAQLDDLLTEEMSRAELILRYTISNPCCHATIVGTANLIHLAENVAAAEVGPLPPKLKQEIDNRIHFADRNSPSK